MNSRPRSDNPAVSLPQYGSRLPNPIFPPSSIPPSIPPGSYVNPAFQFGGLGLNLPSESPQRTFAGHKRKLDALREPKPVESPNTPVAPSVPSFGAPIVPLKIDRSSALPSNAGPPKKRTTNVLGLTPAGEQQYSSSESDHEDDEVDEEAMFAELGTTLTFEHNGTVLSLNSAADLAKWKKERSKNFPTKARTAMKMDEKRQIGGERRRLLVQASDALREARRPKEQPRKPKVQPEVMKPSVERISETKLEKAKRELSTQADRLEELRKKVAKSEALAVQLKAQKAARELTQANSPEAVAEADDREEKEGDSPAQDNNDDEDANSSSSESSVISSDSSDSSDDDDEPPEQTSSKLPPVTSGTKQPLCTYYVASGQCRDGDACRFRHELPERGTGHAYRESQDHQQQQRRQPKRDPHAPPELATIDRKTIFQRMMDQEHGGEDQLALQVIKYLGRMNFFAEKHQE
ncbi:unnamed protein product [Zymoseptoria tritici ST99CH_3D7]|uniref:C3H1-type domain-containing protein n=2 Tax=Zymoseptoria tritici TaxID=1047171 RepID=A0A1X7RHJ3_ZYMT9|nr:unnamed protein product [Zymoseptoria tritici ST99CH_3D7]